MLKFGEAQHGSFFGHSGKIRSRFLVVLGNVGRRVNERKADFIQGRHEKMDNNSGQGVVVGLVVGVAIGAAIGLLLAPKPGEEVRELVRQGISEGLGRVRRIREERESSEE